MSAFDSPHRSIHSILRAIFCQALAAAIVLLAVIPFPGKTFSTQAKPVQAAAYPSGLTKSTWDNLQRVIQEEESSPARQSPTNTDRAPRSPLATGSWLQQVQLNPADAISSMAFGYSVAIDGDTIVVGAYWDNHETAGRGSAYVFEKPAAGWSAVTQAAKLTASDFAFHDCFGWSVAISGNTVVVGTPDDDTTPGISKHGSAYVFQKPGTGWADMTETAKLTASDKASGDEFGRSVAISGNTIVVGVPFDDLLTNTDQGSVYIFSKPGGGWVTSTETAKLTASDGTSGDRFGNAVAISGNTIVAGAYAHDNGHGIGSGKAYIFSQSGSWSSGTEIGVITASDTLDHEYFGMSVAIDGDVVVIGAPGENTFDNSGEESVYVFLKSLTGWAGNHTENAVLTASDGHLYDNFGKTVSISGDTIAVGANESGPSIQEKQGSMYVFTKPAGGWSSSIETEKLLSTGGTSGDEFGAGVAVSGTAILVGAPKDNVNETGDHQGSAYIFDTTLPIEPTYRTYLPLSIR